MLIELLYGKRFEEAGVTGGNTELPKSPASATSSFARLSPDLTPSQSSPFPVDVEVVMTKDDAYYHDYRVFLVRNALKSLEAPISTTHVYRRKIISFRYQYVFLLPSLNTFEPGWIRTTD